MKNVLCNEWEFYSQGHFQTRAARGQAPPSAWERGLWSAGHVLVYMRHMAAIREGRFWAAMCATESSHFWGRLTEKKQKLGCAPPRVPARCDRRRHDAPCMQAKAGRTFGRAVRARWGVRCAVHFVLLIDSVPAHSGVFFPISFLGALGRTVGKINLTRVCVRSYTRVSLLTKILHARVSAHPPSSALLL